MSDDKRSPFLWSLNFLSDDVLKAVGCVAIESAFLEWSLESDLLIVCELDSHIGELVVGSLMLDKKLDLLRQAITPLLKDDASLKKELADVFAEIKQAIVDRNTVIHGVWLSDRIAITKEENGDLRITVSGQKKAIKFSRGAKQPRVVLADDVMALARHLAECRERLVKALAQCTDWGALLRSRDERQSRRGLQSPDPKQPKPE